MAPIVRIEFQTAIGGWHLREQAQNRNDPCHAEENRFTKSSAAVG
jgi:hypothetical protein